MYTRLSQIIVLTLITLCSGNPFATTPKPAHVLAKRANQCGDSTFKDATQDAATRTGALLTDCQQLAANIQSERSWCVEPGVNFNNLISFGSCAFWARSQANPAATIGNQDIIDLMSVVQFNVFFVIGDGGDQKTVIIGSGEMPCQAESGGDGQSAVVEWMVASPETAVDLQV